MKVIDLLNKIANGEEVPKKIRYKNKSYIYSNECRGYYLGTNPERIEAFAEFRLVKRISNGNMLNDEVEVIGEKEETKTTTRKSIEALGYACGEIQKCFTNGWEKSLKNKSLNEEDKNIKRLPYYDYNEINVEKNRDKFIEKILEKHDKRLNDYHDKINEIIDYINGGTNGE